MVSKCVDMLEKVLDGKHDAKKMKSLQRNSLSSLKLCIGALTKMEERSSAMLRLSGFTRSMTYYFMRVRTEERDKRKVEHASERQRGKKQKTEPMLEQCLKTIICKGETKGFN